MSGTPRRRRALGAGPGRPTPPPGVAAGGETTPPGDTGGQAPRQVAEAAVTAEVADAAGRAEPATRTARETAAQPESDAAAVPRAAEAVDVPSKPVTAPDTDQDARRGGEAEENGDTGREAAGPAADAGGRAGGEETGGDDGDADGDGRRFRVVLENFEGPFDLLLQLISKHRLDVTEVALSRVTDEFLAYLGAMGPDVDLDQTTEFLVVAATLLDLKAARLLPAAEVEDEEDLALLEARDLLFARLLQYRAFKRVADILADRLAAESRRFPRTVGLEPHHAELLPEVVINIGPEGFARLAVKAMQPKPRPQVYVDHIHTPLVSVREQAQVVIAHLREHGEATFSDLVRDAPDTLTVVARFLALLELYRERAVALDQAEALGPLTVRWTGADDGRDLVTDEFDRVPERDDHKERT